VSMLMTVVFFKSQNALTRYSQLFKNDSLLWSSVVAFKMILCKLHLQCVLFLFLTFI
jgi:hypothetical protein